MKVRLSSKDSEIKHILSSYMYDVSQLVSTLASYQSLRALIRHEDQTHILALEHKKL